MTDVRWEEVAKLIADGLRDTADRIEQGKVCNTTLQFMVSILVPDKGWEPGQPVPQVWESIIEVKMPVEALKNGSLIDA